jgi:SAM-dependent methyltransferase
MTDPAVRREITELYAEQGWPDGGDALLGRSLGPRSPELLLDAPGWLGLEGGGLVLDAGCRDATHAIALARRYGCRVLGVDLVAAWLPKGLADAAAAGLAGQVDLVQGDLQALPVGDGACDLVWCRDTLSCLPDCGLALRECARVLRPGGGMVLYAVFAGERLETGDRALLVQGLGNSPASMHRPTVEAAIAAAGFKVRRRERIGSEWTEHRLGARPWRPHPEPAGGGPAHPRPRAHGGRAGVGLVPARPGVRALAPPDPARPAGAGAVRAGQALTGSLGSGCWLYQCRLGGLSSLNACSGGGA